MSALVVVMLLLLALRPLSALRDLELGDARTGRQLVAAVRGAGWARCAGRTVWAVTVVTALVLAAVCAGFGVGVHAVGRGLWLIGSGLAEVVPAPEVRA